MKNEKNEDKENQSKKRRPLIYIISIVLICMTTLFSIYIFLYKSEIIFKKGKISKPEQSEEWITIFTHGTFGCLLGLLNVVEVIQDNISGTNYKKLVNKVRNDDYFYKSQPMLQKGLIKFAPTFDLNSIGNKKYVVYPIAKSYDFFLNSINISSENNNFYTFGWSGLISQQRRRKEAIRFYNQLSKEIEKYKQKGINPKIRIICHSHGGNLALNLAGIKNVIKNLNNPETLKIIAKNNDEYDSLINIYQIIKQLPNKPLEHTYKNSSQKNFDYIPNNNELVIDELVLLGTPIQQETEPFIFDNTFKNVFNFYSDEDFVQKIDWISTKKRYSFNRFNLLDILLDKKNKTGFPKIIQAKIMFRPNIHKNLNKTFTTNQPTASFWSSFFSFKRKNLDPTHKELWFASWENEDYLNPLPIVVLTPIFLNMIKKLKNNFDDIDININFSDKKMKLYVFQHNKLLVEDKISIPISTLNEIKTKFFVWKPEDVSSSTEFNIIKKHSSCL
ncbi:hypothetical protein GF322_04290 [Candidatus Dependentiae bacterium]|nr:hypothetical protein [Candidatus Dependentiae bacterium]